MATLQQVIDALTARVRAAVTPLNIPFVAYAGWPTQDAITREVCKGERAHLAVYDLGVEANASRFLPDWRPLADPIVSMGVTYAAGRITFTGAPAAGLNVGVTIGGRRAVAYTLTAQDTTLSAVAQHVAAAINAAGFAGVSATTAGATLSVAGGNATAVVGGAGAVAAEVARTRKQFMLLVWAPSPEAREALAEAVRLSLDADWWLALGDGRDGLLSYVKTTNHEPQFNGQAWRRDLVYSVEFASVATAPATQIVGIQDTLGRLP